MMMTMMMMMMMMMMMKASLRKERHTRTVSTAAINISTKFAEISLELMSSLLIKNVKNSAESSSFKSPLPSLSRISFNLFSIHMSPKLCMTSIQS